MPCELKENETTPGRVSVYNRHRPEGERAAARADRDKSGKERRMLGEPSLTGVI